MEKEFIEEIVGMREILSKWGYVKVEDVKGYCVLYIQVGGNIEFKILKDVGFMFEFLMFIQMYRDFLFWFYILEY